MPGGVAVSMTSPGRSVLSRTREGAYLAGRAAAAAARRARAARAAAARRTRGSRAGPARRRPRLTQPRTHLHTMNYPSPINICGIHTEDDTGLPDAMILQKSCHVISYATGGLPALITRQCIEYEKTFR